MEIVHSEMHNHRQRCSVYSTILHYTALWYTEKEEREKNTLVYSIKKNMVRDAIKDYLNRLKIYV